MNLNELKENKISYFMFIFVLLTMNINKVIKLTENISFNMAFSDMMVLFAFGVVILIVFREKSLKAIFGLPMWILLVFWLVFVGFLGIRSKDIVDGGWVGLFEELFKTGLCIIYFIVGFNTLKILKSSIFKVTWSIAILIFVFGGIFIFLLALKGVYYWSEDLNYFMMFMGTDTDPNHAATFLSISFFAMGIFILKSKIKREKIWFLAMLFISIFGLFLTGSRGGIIGFIIGIMVIFVYYIKKNWRFAISIFCGFIFVCLIFLQVDNFAFEGMLTQRVANKLTDFDGGMDIRWSLGYSAFLMGNDNPITGVGRGNFPLNSAQYFNRIGVDHIDNIPHNTYFGLYAEVGIIGLILFLMPLLLFFLTLYKRYSGNKQKLKIEFEYLIWIFAGLVTLGVQAFVLNIENRRFIWFIMGVLIFEFQNKGKQFTVLHDNTNILWRKPMIITISATIICFVLVSHNVYITKDSMVVKGSQVEHLTYELPLESVNFGSENQVGLQLTLENNSDLTDRINISIAEVEKNGNINVLYSKNYKGLRGRVFLDFIPSENIKSVAIKVTSLDQTLQSYIFKPLCVVNKNKAYELDKWYFLQPTFYRELLTNSKKVAIEEYLPSTDLSESLGNSFSKYFRIKNITYQNIYEFDKNESKKNSTQVVIQYEVIEKPEQNFKFVLLGFPYYLDNVEEATIINGYEEYFTMDSISTSNWVKGETYLISYVIPRQEGVYQLYNGMSYFKDDKWSFIQHYEGTNKQSSYVELGWLNLDFK